MSNPYVQSDPGVQKVALAPILFVGFLMLLLFWFATKWLFFSQPELTDEEAVRSVERNEILQNVLEQANADLNRYGWKDIGAGIVQIPVQRAMELEILTLNINRDIRPAYPIEPPTVAPPEPSAADPTSTDPAEDVTPNDGGEPLPDEPAAPTTPATE